MIEILPLEGALKLSQFFASDERGGILKAAEAELLERLGFSITEVLFSTNRKGALRGMHYQDPSPQAKIVFCISGRVFDVIADLRPGSRTHRKWLGIELSKENRTGIYAPKGFAHGFLSLEENSTLAYLIDGKVEPESERGIRYDDPALGIAWPVLGIKPVLSKRDRGFALLE
ncbi:MAG: dTDP-4-dehydrorhamnose 3,5-epimerase [Candidatus Micrarchaeota archaeon]|nr:dTDP-4-dehydrorhamnose 3,5-epimerase [Candidatus Micrarchaeota archaeon]